MKNILFKILSIFLLAIIFSSCTITKTKKSISTSNEKEKQKYIYLFSEANKNRLLGDSEKAISQYLACLDINPESAVSNFYLSALFLSEKKYNSSLTFAEKSIELQPDNLWYNLIIADIYSSQNKNKQAYNQYNKLHKEKPGNELLYDRIIKLLKDDIKKESYINNLESTQNIISDYKKLTEIYNNKQNHYGYSEETSMELYKLYMSIKNFDKAKQTLNILTEKENNNPKYKALLAEFYLSTNKTKEAEKIYKNLIEKYPNNIFVQFSYTVYCKYAGKKEEYYINVKELLSSDIELNLKVNLLISGRYPNFSKNRYEELLHILYKYHYNDLITNTLLAEFYIDEDKNKSIPFLKKAVELSNADFTLILTFFEVSYDTRNFELLYESSKKYLEIYPNRPKVFLYHGIACYNLKKYDQAIFSLDLGKDYVIDDNELLLQFHFYLAEIFHNIKQYQKSDEQFEKVIKLNPKFYLALTNYSYYLCERNENIEKALSMSEKCINYQPDNPIFCDTYSKALLLNQEYSKALTFSEKAITKIQNNPDFLENHGDILFANNKKEEALEYWKKSKKAGNTSEKIIYKIKNINSLTIEEL